MLGWAKEDTWVNVIYASDLDRTLIYSKRFINEHPSNSTYSPVEYKGVEIISYMSDKVKDKLNNVANNNNVEFVPVTSRSIEEYNRVNLGIKPEYAIVSNGGTILHKGEPMDEWEEYFRNSMDKMNWLDAINTVQMEFTTFEKTRIVDNKYIFGRTLRHEEFDAEANEFGKMLPGWQITRQGNKVYIIPDNISKQIALRWLWHRLGNPYIVASGDGLLDLGMLSLANKAIIPSHAVILDNHVEKATIAEGGIDSPLFTMDVIGALV